MAVLVGSVEGKWIFAPADTGTEVTWHWILHRSRPDRTGAAGVRQDLEGLRAAGPRDAVRTAGGLNAHVSTLWLARRDRRLHRDVLVAGRAGQPGRAEQEKPGRHGPGRLRRARPAAATQGADSGLAGRRLRHRSASDDRHDVHRPCPLCDDRVARRPQHPPVFAGRPDLRAQRRARGPGRPRCTAARGRHRRPGFGPDRFRAGVRLDHRLDPRPGRRRDRGSGRRHDDGSRRMCRSMRSTCCSARPPTCGRCATPSPTSSTSWTGDETVAPKFDMRTKRIHAWSEQLCTRPSVVFATERMDDDPRWSLLAPGSWSTSTPGCGSPEMWCCPTRPDICCVARI